MWNTQSRKVKSPIDSLILDKVARIYTGHYYYHHSITDQGQFNMTASFQKFINEIDTSTLWDPLNNRQPEITCSLEIGNLRNIKVSPINALMA